MGELETDRNAYEHAQPGLLCHKRAHRSCALLLVVLGRHTTYLGLMCLTEPAPFCERFGEHTLKRGGSVHNNVLGVG
jgi:hypothetical protein